MKCQKCGKNQAEVHYVQTINGESIELRLCPYCASETFCFSPLSFSNFLQGFFSFSDKMGGYQEKSETKSTCPKCGANYDEIIKSGKVGCAECYTVFSSIIESVLMKVQAGTEHTGKIPKNAEGAAKKLEILTLKAELSTAVKKEDFEKAAEIRDKIKALKGDGADE